jgi:hypothetical protein
MSISVTPIPRVVSLAVPAFTLGTANAAGSATTAVASDSTLLAFDTATPDAITFGQSGAAGSAVVTSRRDHAHAMESATAPVFGRVVRTAGNITTTSTSLVDVTGATITFTTGAFPVQYSAAQVASNNTTASTNWFNADIDGTALHGTEGLPLDQEVGDKMQDASFSAQTAALSAGSHTIKETWKVGANTGQIVALSNAAHMWSAFEIR